MKHWQSVMHRFLGSKPKKTSKQSYSAISESKTNKFWLDLQYHSGQKGIKKPNELEEDIQEPPIAVDDALLNRIQGSMIGLALGDALGAHVEFQPRQYLEQHPVRDLRGGGTWGLEKGQFTDDTSMALCLANSLVAKSDFILYDQLVRYNWWYKYGYMSSTGQCFDIGAATSDSLKQFAKRQETFAKKHKISEEQMDTLSDPDLLRAFDVYCSQEEVAGNGALMRLAPVPLFFYRFPPLAVEYSGLSGLVTHGDQKAYDACRYYGALIVAALHGFSKDQLLDKKFYAQHREWFGATELCYEIRKIAEGSYQKSGGYAGGIRGKGYIVNALEAALWAFWSDGNSFETGALAAVNLGDDTDTTAAIYGQLAGAYYGFDKLPSRWVRQVYAKKFVLNLCKWIAYEGKIWQRTELTSPVSSAQSSQPYFVPTIPDTIGSQSNSNVSPFRPEVFDDAAILSIDHRNMPSDSQRYSPRTNNTNSSVPAARAVSRTALETNQETSNVNRKILHPPTQAQPREGNNNESRKTSNLPNATSSGASSPSSERKKLQRHTENLSTLNQSNSLPYTDEINSVGRKTPGRTNYYNDIGSQPAARALVDTVDSQLHTRKRSPTRQPMNEEKVAGAYNPIPYGNSLQTTSASNVQKTRSKSNTRSRKLGDQTLENPRPSNPRDMPQLDTNSTYLKSKSTATAFDDSPRRSYPVSSSTQRDVHLSSESQVSSKNSDSFTMNNQSVDNIGLDNPAMITTSYGTRQNPASSRSKRTSDISTRV